MNPTSKIFYLVFFLFISACSKNDSIYQDLAPSEDGVVSFQILDDGYQPVIELPRIADVLSAKEKELVKKWHSGQENKINFIVVDAKNKKVVRSHFGEVPSRLASVSKVTTAIAALENVNNIEVSKVKNMLKISHNGEASRYVRLAAKAIDGLVITAPSYSQPHSCPGAILNDEPAGEVVLQWIQSVIPTVDWAGSNFDDGAGCDYDNFMSPLQTAKVLDFASQQGPVYAGLEFKKLLSIAGVDGTWEDYNIENKGYIFAKTGTLNPTSNLAGYFIAKRGGVFYEYYFAIFVAKEGGTTSSSARNLMEALLRYWIDYYAAYIGEPIKDF